MYAQEHFLRGHKALIVNDDPDNLLVSRTVLEYCRASVRVARSWPEALKLAAAWQPTIILLDIAMPNVDGSETLRDLREIPNMASIPVIAFTPEESAAGSSVECLYDSGFTGHLLEPFEIEDLLNALTDCLQDYSTNRPHPPESPSSA